MSSLKLPNVKSLQVLVAVARAGSFSAAAVELSVTQSAISKQIATLEAHFGKPLFHRFHRRVEITDFGRTVVDIAEDAFDRLESGLSETRPAGPEQIHLAGDADFVELWLFPRLRRFEAAHPDVRISISVTVGMQNPPATPYDCAVIWGRGTWRRCRFEPLMTNSVFPVAASDVARSLGARPQLSQISARQLIHDQTTFWWRAFLEASADRSPAPEAGRIYNRSSLCLAAAARGDGITIGDEVTARGHIETGALVLPFGVQLPSPDAYYLVQPETAPKHDAVDLFLDWLRTEAEEHRQFFTHFWQKRRR